MNNLQPYDVIKLPHSTEKATLMADKNKRFTFRVDSKACKQNVRKAVEKLFNVKVTAVSILNVKPKNKRFRQMAGKRQGWKKAIVSIDKDSDINIAEFE